MEYSNNTASAYKLATTIKIYPCRYVKQQCDIKSKFKFLFKKAFTLAEVLITLTIIGVVAAMTIPTLMTKYQKHTYVVGLKKAYSEISNALRMLPINENCSPEDRECWGFYVGNEDRTLEILSRQFKTVKTGFSYEECNDMNLDASSCFIKQDGMIITNFSTNGIFVDVNGQKGPNKTCQDIFGFYIVTPSSLDYIEDDSKNSVQYGTLVPMGSKMLTEYAQEDSSSFSCTARVLEEGAINY